VDEDAGGADGRFYIYNYEGHEERHFDARFTRDDRVAIGDVWGDDLHEEIVVAINDDSKVYIYSGDSTGTPLHTFNARFTKFDCLAVGNVCNEGKDEIVIAIDEDDKVYIYNNRGALLVEFDIPWDFHGSCNIGKKKDDYNDAMAVGDVFGDESEEILLLDRHGDESQVYIYEVDETTLRLKMRFPVRFTKYDAFATGDVLGNDKEEILIAIDEDHTVYIYDAVGGLLKLRYAKVTPVDGLAAGNVCGGPKDEILIGIDDDHKVYIASEEL
jgi:outer membrane protein assembly factor BamB